MAAIIKQTMGIGSELISGGQGIFDILVEGELVYSKFKTGSFPDEDQLINELISLFGRK